MISRLAADLWTPVGVVDLEPAADEVVRRASSTLVYAGPGSGKTELLAQRACFLLQTGICRDPRRILAISFKKDAAKNLRERVAARCGGELARRFDSSTFDAFSKGLVDRFRNALPSWCRPTADYIVLPFLNGKSALNIFRESVAQLSVLSPRDRHSIGEATLWSAFIRPLPCDRNWQSASVQEVAAGELWKYLIKGGSQSSLAFPMIGRMAELILRQNPGLLCAMRSTYGFVFLDEFQDTTSIQYDLVLAAFHGSRSVVTAVGDDKQRIMGWAGAMPQVFDRFVTDFGASTTPLVRNYRSSPKLVRIQSVIARALNPNVATVESMISAPSIVDECRVLRFPDDDAEAAQLAFMIKTWIERDGLRPRDICVLYRMKAPVYTDKLRAALSEAGVRARIENEVQELLSEPLSEVVLNLIRLACRDRDAGAWGRTVELISELRGYFDNGRMQRTVDDIARYLVTIQLMLAKTSAAKESIEELIKGMLQFVGESEFRSLYPQYSQGEWYQRVMGDLVAALAKSRERLDWPEVLNDLDGLDTVPIMTTHKSKGLEFHTVVFVGLEDEAHWSFRSNSREETCGFFVAFSRARRRVVFTYAGIRPTGRGMSRQVQTIASVRPLYDLFDRAGVAVENGGDAQP